MGLARKVLHPGGTKKKSLLFICPCTNKFFKGFLGTLFEPKPYCFCGCEKYRVPFVRDACPHHNLDNDAT